MATVVLIGADGSGKTTLARRLLQSGPFSKKYLYMGWTTESSNFALPTSRLVQMLRSFFRTRSGNRPHKSRALSTFIDQPGTHEHHGKLFAAARLLNRLAEDWYREFISWNFQLRGYIVIYDRHPLFEAAFKYFDAGEGKQRLSHRLHCWLITFCHPKPDLIFYLDAPAEVLYDRKKEDTIECLQMRQKALLAVAGKLDNFLRIDATQPVDKVYEEVNRHIIERFKSKKIKKTQPSYGLSN